MPASLRRTVPLIKLFSLSLLPFLAAACDSQPAAPSSPVSQTAPQDSQPITPVVAPESPEDSTTTEPEQAPAARTATPAAVDTAHQPVAENFPAPDAAATPFVNPISAAEAAAGWISLFDGHSLFGWTANDPGVNWHVDNGTITADSGPIGLLLTTAPWADFEFQCEYRMEAKGNSGIFLRTLPQPGNVTTDCYELNMADAHPEGYLTGSLVGRAKTAEPLQGSGDWKSISAVCEGKHFQVSIDGAQVLDYLDESAAPRLVGQIGLQKNKGKIEFRKVRLRPLGMSPLFNGTDLSGWRVVPGSKSQFSVQDGVIRCVNGQGFLETEATYGNFVFQAQAQTHAAELNSGYFFRAMPGTEQAPSNGYEAQIHNGYLDGDRTRPNNAGTGAIFRRVEARRVIPNDLEWFTMTLAAAGNQISVWVDGYQVVDWVDTRDPDENPRRGRRDEAGHISLQGHDPTTDMSFRSLHIVELPSEQ